MGVPRRIGRPHNVTMPANPLRRPPRPGPAAGAAALALVAAAAAVIAAAALLAPSHPLRAAVEASSTSAIPTPPPAPVPSIATTATGGPRETAETGAWPAYASSIRPVRTERLGASWRGGCPVGAGGLRLVTVRYVGFDGRWRDGELVVAADLAADVARAFGVLYARRFPIRGIRTVENYGASDDASMRADNTSAFNCRAITGGTGWSPHAYGRAIDLNPRENPYVSGRTVLPANATLDRTVSGAVTPAVVAAFRGWTWGGTWANPTDYQHFEHR
jgi:D-alanyl-D-alanine carboxypeptidase